MTMKSRCGGRTVAFDPWLAVLKDSFVQLGLLPEQPTDDQMITRQFVPVKF